MDSDHALWCIVPAAGRSLRFGGEVAKQYEIVHGKPLLHWTLERLVAHPSIAGVCVVLAADDALGGAILDDFACPVLRAVGGATRADSVLAGLAALPDSVRPGDFVLVHDAARPCVRAPDISRLIVEAMAFGGGLLAAALTDTLKRGDDQRRVVTTEARESRWRALTPQMFRRGELATALVAAANAGLVVTDEAMAMEQAGHQPLIVEGAADNIKVTTRADLDLVEFMLARGI